MVETLDWCEGFETPGFGAGQKCHWKSPEECEFMGPRDRESRPDVTWFIYRTTDG
jgi:hypothetical protein